MYDRLCTWKFVLIYKKTDFNKNRSWAGFFWIKLNSKEKNNKNAKKRQLTQLIYKKNHKFRLKEVNLGR